MVFESTLITWNCDFIYAGVVTWAMWQWKRDVEKQHDHSMFSVFTAGREAFMLNQEHLRARMDLFQIPCNVWWLCFHISSVQNYKPKCERLFFHYLVMYSSNLLEFHCLEAKFRVCISYGMSCSTFYVILGNPQNSLSAPFVCLHGLIESLHSYSLSSTTKNV